MKRTKIRGTGLVSSSMSLGGVPLGSRLDEQASFRLMDQYVDRGGNMVDTAEVYANWLPNVERSVSETTIGNWMKARGNRDRLIVTTKGAHPRLESMDKARMTREDVTSDVDGSLKRLRTETVDLYWLHRDDRSRDVGEILATMNELVRAGKIRYFGCSNWTAERLAEAQRYAGEHGMQGFSGNQMMWSFADVDPARFADPTLVAMDEETKRLHRDSGLTAVPYSSQAQGLFAKLAAGRLSFDDESIAPMYRTETNRIRCERARSLADAMSLTMTQVTLGYLLSQPFPTVPIIGARTEEQLEECLRADEVRFSPEQLGYLEGRE